MLHSKDCAELCLKVKEREVSQLCPTLCDPVDYSPPDSSIHGIFQARILEWIAISFFRDIPDPGIELTSLMSPALASGFLTTSTTWEAQMKV